MRHVRDALLGTLIGDSLGVPHEFKQAHDVPAADQIEMVMPADYRKTYAHVSYGTWPDDGSQTLCLLDTLAQNGGHFDLHDFAAQLLAWRDKARHQAGGVVNDCGGQTAWALDRWRNGQSVDLTERGQGNGSLMRVIPATLLPSLWKRSPSEALTVAMQQSTATHPHPVLRACCAVYAQIALLWIADKALSVDSAVRQAFDLVARDPALDSPELQAALRSIRTHGEREMPTGSGYVVDSLWSSVWSLRQGHDYLSAVRAAISLGQDTDTTAAVTGGLAGIRWGLDSVPLTWLNALTFPCESRALLDKVIETKRSNLQL